MRIRRLPGMPWGEDALLEFHPLVSSIHWGLLQHRLQTRAAHPGLQVAKEWPPAEGLPEKH